jgi:hypothetical protein
VQAAASSAYTEIQNLRKEVNFNGKSDTAYSLLKNLNESIEEIKNSVGGISTGTAEAQIKEVAQSIEKTREELKKAASEAGIKGAVAKEEVRKGPVTLDSLQNQMAELKAMLQAMKALLEKKEEPVVKTWFESGSVKLKMVVANPSDTEARTIPVKSYLPKGVKPEDITDKGNFQVSYDFELSLYYIYQEVLLQPKESITLELVMKDIWIVADEEIKAVKDHVNKIMNILKPTQYYNQAKPLADNIIERLDKIAETQNSIGVSTEEKLSKYETNVTLLKEAKKDLSVLEDLAIETGGIPGEKLFGESPESAAEPRIESTGLDIEKLGTIKFKIEVSNPVSSKETYGANPSAEKKVVPLKYYLPIEVKPEYIVDKGGLEIAYDYQKGIHYCYKNDIYLAPQEKKEFVVAVKDVWVIPEEQVQTLKAHAVKLMDMLKDSEYKEPSGFLGNKIVQELDGIIAIQNNPNVTVERHIGDYRTNLVKFDNARKDVAKLERLVIQAGGSPGLTLIGKGVGGLAGQPVSGLNRQTRGPADSQTTKGLELVGKSIFRGKAPDATTSWKIIWTIVAFLAVVSFLFFILWWTQIKRSEGKKKEKIG